MAAPEDSRAVRAAIRRWRELASADERSDRRLLIAASFTANPVEPALGVALAEFDGAPPEIRLADYNQVFQVCLQPELHGIGADHEVVVLWRIEDVFDRDFHAWANGEPGALDRLVDGAHSLGAAVRGLSATCRVTVADAPVPIGHGLDHDDPALLTELVELQSRINHAFDGALGDGPIDRVRLAALQTAAGTTNTFDRRTWLMYHQPFTDWFAHRVGTAIADVIRARTRPTPKVIVLDADDTLWAGVAVDDGIGGLQADDAFPGFAHRSFQRAVQRLRHRGILLAVASKNDRETVDLAFQQVDGMVLVPDDIAGWRVSWNPKPDAIAELATEFNLGLDSFVFVDDSEYETGSVATQLPDVTVLRVPEDIEELPDLLAESGLFRLARVTDDDRSRTTRMIEESGRAAAATAMSHDEFLASLDLHVRLLDVGSAEIGRVTQLVNKTNQFNVTTVRRDEAEITTLAAATDSKVFAISVDDRFGDYGIVGVVIGVHDADGWSLDTVLMSCRVLGRGVETAMLASTVTEMRAERPGQIIARYEPTAKNALVANLFVDHGFAPAGDGTFVLAADTTLAAPTHVTVTGP